LIEGDIFFGKYFYSFFVFFFIFLSFFVCLGGFPLNMVVRGRLLGPFKDVFQKPIKI